MDYLKYIIVAAFLIFAMAYFVFLFWKFKMFCQKIAIHENRLREFCDIRRDEGGLNRFELEVFRKISAHGYDEVADPELCADADFLRRKLTIGYFFGAALVIFFVLVTK